MPERVAELVNIEVAREILEKELPPVVLLLGPDQVELRELSHHLVEYWSHERYYIDVIDAWTLNAASAREIGEFALWAPTGKYKFILISLDGASEQAQNALLKVLEEPPPPVRFILRSTRTPLPTVASRAQVFQLGSVESEPEPLEDTRKVRAIVQATLRAAVSGEPGALSAPMRSWNTACTAYLARWALEAACGRWGEFDASFAPGVSEEQARVLLHRLANYAGSRTGAAVALGQAFRKD